MSQALRIYDEAGAVVHLSEALDHQNRVFQLAHVLCLVELPKVLQALTAGSGIRSESGVARCHAELANYFAAAFLMPYQAFYEAAEGSNYDVDRLAAAFGVSFEQVCHRLTTLQREGSRGVPFFFLRVDKAGNVTKRFNATSFHIAEYGGACPVWNIHTSFRTPGVIVPQFVELPDGDRFFTISRTTERPVFSRDTQDRRLALSLGCELQHAHRLAYAAPSHLAAVCKPQDAGARLRAAVRVQAEERPPPCLRGVVQAAGRAAVQSDRHQLPPRPEPGLLAAGAPAALHRVADRPQASRQHPLRKLTKRERVRFHRAAGCQAAEGQGGRKLGGFLHIRRRSMYRRRHRAALSG